MTKILTHSELSDAQKKMLDRLLLWGPLNEQELQNACGDSWRIVWQTLADARIVRYAPYARDKRCYRMNEHYYSERIKNAK